MSRIPHQLKSRHCSAFQKRTRRVCKRLSFFIAATTAPPSLGTSPLISSSSGDTPTGKFVDNLWSDTKFKLKPELVSCGILRESGKEPIASASQSSDQWWKSCLHKYLTHLMFITGIDEEHKAAQLATEIMKQSTLLEALEHIDLLCRKNVTTWKKEVLEKRLGPAVHILEAMGGYLDLLTAPPKEVNLDSQLANLRNPNASMETTSRLKHLQALTFIQISLSFLEGCDQLIGVGKNQMVQFARTRELQNLSALRLPKLNSEQAATKLMTHLREPAASKN